MRILIANRGEIARRIIRTSNRLSIETVAAYADPDSSAPFVGEATMATRLGPAELAGSYLSADALLSAADRTGADAVHPGYGFLSESEAFARAVSASGRIWIGPHADAIAAMGSKIEARRLAQAVGVPVIPGFDSSQGADELMAAAGEIGYPVLIKASAGGGGKGIRVVDDPADFDGRLSEARSEALRGFGSDDVIVERYVSRPRHVEVQVLGDRHGTVVELGTRECSVQRRYQKVLEEAPAPNLADRTRRGLQSAAVELARSIGYDSAGTVEFIVDDDTGDFFFLEMNTRIQVEHTVTEAITGLDLIELQIRSAVGEPLATIAPVELRGHAFEARINAEDASDGFSPQIGTITHLRVPDGVRWDSAVEVGSDIGPLYDSMIAKLIVHGPDRATALDHLRTALDQLIVGGPVSTGGFQRWLVDQPPIVDGRVTTRFLHDTELPPRADAAPAASAAARAWCCSRDAARRGGPWSALAGFRTTPHRGPREVALLDGRGEVHDLTVDTTRAEAEPIDSGPRPTSVDLDGRSVAVNDAGQTHTFRVLGRSERWAPPVGRGHGHPTAVVAPFPAMVVEVRVGPDDSVAAGETVVVIEAMKMLHTLAAAGPGLIDEVRVAVGDQVATAQVLVTFHTRDASSAAAHTSDASSAAAHTNDNSGGGP